jgi:hypothetical protein
MVVPKYEPDHQPAFMAIAPDDLAELQRKAALLDRIVELLTPRK